MRRLNHWYLTLLAIIVVAMASSVAADEQDQAAFYDGKTVQLLIGFSPGGGYDTYGRTLARHLSKHLPGNPSVIAKNVPGAGSLVLMNQVANVLPNDGTAIAAVNSGIPFEPLFGNKQAQFDPKEMGWLGSLNVATALGVATDKSGIQSWEDLKSGSMTMGATGASSNTNIIPQVLKELYGVNINVITGYPGSRDVVMAMERGEVDGIGGQFMSTIAATLPAWLKEDSPVNVLYQVGRKRHRDLPNVPLVSEFAQTERERQTVDLLAATLVMGRPYVAPPGVPAERLATLRKALADTAKDPEFLADAKKQGLPVDFVGGEEMQAFFGKAYSYPDEIVNVIKSARSQ